MKNKHLHVLAFAFLTLTKMNAQSPGDLLITEFMADPAKVADASGEWIELYNTTDHVMDINGWHLKDGGSKNHQLKNTAPLLISSKSFLLLALKGDSTINGGLVPDYVYSSLTLPNTSGKIIIADTSGTTIDSIAYTSAVSGKSWSLDPAHFNTTDHANFSYWCTPTSTYGAGDFGTPKHINPGCMVTETPTITVKTIVTTAVHSNELVIHISNPTEKQAWDILDVSGQLIQSGIFPENTTNFSITLNRISRGIYFLRLHKTGMAVKFIIAN